MDAIPPTPVASKSPSPGYPEYPWLPNAHRVRPTQGLHEQESDAVDGLSRLRKSNIPPDLTPDSPSITHPLQRFIKRETSPADSMESIPQATEDLPAESADDERDDDLESEDEADQDETEVVDPLCTAIAECVANSGDHRKVVSHIFGRNKICTSQIPSECWIFYCRKHYQRHRFRAKETGWKRTQFDIIKRQLARLDTWGGVIDWEIALRKKEREELAIANRHALLNNTQPTYRESFLEPYLGSGKSFQEVNQVLQAIETETMTTNAKDLPGFELLPNIDKNLHPANKATRSPQKPKADAHVAKSTTITKRKRAVSASAKLPTADAKLASKRRRLVQASSDAATTSPLEDTDTSSPAPSTILGFRSVNPAHQLPIRPARHNSKAKELKSAEDSHFADISEES